MISNRLREVQQLINRAAGERDHLLKSLESHKSFQEEAEERLNNALLAKQLVLAVAEKTQLNIGQRITDLVSLALASVFDNPYEFLVEFVQRRGVTETDLWFVRGGHKLEPLDASGFGVVNIASLALRLAVWTLNKSGTTFILDEPFRDLSSDYHAAAGLMLQELSRRLGIQIIMVSHNQEIIAGADKVFRLLLKNEETKVITE